MQIQKSWELKIIYNIQYSILNFKFILLYFFIPFLRILRVEWRAIFVSIIALYLLSSQITFIGLNVNNISLSEFLASNSFSRALSLLTLFTLIVCQLRIFCISATFSKSLNFFLIFISIVRIILFYSNSWLTFYVMFELSLIPILMIILGWGYQIERIKARKALLFYTISGSLPLILVILFLKILGNEKIFQKTLELSTLYWKEWLFLVIRLAFFVKLPAFFVHIWLPKAHVEAPVVGSIFLASILLKLGGYGLFLLTPLFSSLRWVNLFFLSVTLWGLVIVPLTCCKLIDMKILIAISSVGHIGLAIACFILNNNIRWVCAFLIFLSHGFRSSLIFFQRYLVYLGSHSRSVLLNKAIERKVGVFTLLWRVGCLGIIGAPPCFNLWVEMMSFLTCQRLIRIRPKILFWTAFLTGVYSFLLLRLPYHGNQKKRFLTSRSLYKSHNLVILCHLFWLIIAVLVLNLYYV